MTAYYNEFDPYAAEWLRSLIRDGHIAPGVVDERSIVDVPASDLVGYDQVHFYAGIGGWSAALRLAGWPDNRPIFSASLPCQPFSSAGKQKGFDDDRHLWPITREHIRACRPVRILGEQVASKDGRAWLELVQTDLEALGYHFWAVVLPVAGFGCPGERHRTFWLAYAGGRLADPHDSGRSARHAPASTVGYGSAADTGGSDDRLAYPHSGQRGGITDAGRRHVGDRQASGRIEGYGQSPYGNGHDRLAHPAPVGRGESGAIGSGARCRDGAEGQSTGSLSGCSSQRLGNAGSAGAGWDARAGACGQAPGGSERCPDGRLGDAPVPPGGTERVVGVDHPRLQGHTRNVLHGGQPGRLDPQPHGPSVDGSDGVLRMADADDRECSRFANAERRDEQYGSASRRIESDGQSADGDCHDRMADSDKQGKGGRRIFGPGEGPSESGRAACERSEGLGAHDRPGPLNGFWRDADWLLCTDGRWRPAQSGYEPLAYGLPRGMGTLGAGLGRLALVADCNAGSLKAAKRYRVGSLRGYGNAINLQVAAEWIRVWMDDLL